MQRKRPPAKATHAATPATRRRDTAIPPVPTVLPDRKPAVKAPPTPEVDPAEEAVRRMVEAAYT